jgi:hypothetical protein
MIQKQSNNHYSGRAQHVWSSTESVKGIVHHEFVPPNTMVNSDFYCDV